MSNRKYSKEFKLETLALAKEVGPTQASRRLEISPNLIYRWRQELEQDGEVAFRGQGVMTAQDACMESFFDSLKLECYDKLFKSRKQARLAIFEYIEGFYNRQRLHSTLGYLSPEQFEQQHAS